MLNEAKWLTSYLHMSKNSTRPKLTFDTVHRCLGKSRLGNENFGQRFRITKHYDSQCHRKKLPNDLKMEWIERIIEQNSEVEN